MDKVSAIPLRDLPGGDYGVTRFPGELCRWHGAIWRWDGHNWYPVTGPNLTIPAAALDAVPAAETTSGEA